MSRDPITGNLIINPCDGHLFPHLDKTIKWKFHNNKTILTEASIDNDFGSLYESQLEKFIKEKNTNKIICSLKFEVLGSPIKATCTLNNGYNFQLHYNSSNQKILQGKIENSINNENGTTCKVTFTQWIWGAKVSFLHSTIHERYHEYRSNLNTLDILCKIINKDKLEKRDIFYINNCVQIFYSNPSVDKIPEYLHCYSNEDFSIMLNITEGLIFIAIQPFSKKLIKQFDENLLNSISFWVDPKGWDLVFN